MAFLRIISVALALLLAVGFSNGARIARQASSCKAGIQCISLADCKPLQDLLRNPTTTDLIRVREALCNRNRRNPKVCCEGPSTPIATPPVISVSVTPPTSTGPSVPGGGERLLPANCGRGGLARRIVNGENVDLGSYPWMAILGYTKSQGQVVWGCGGNLINDRYVVTAAHCVLPELPIVEVRLGEHDLTTSPDCIPGTTICALPHQSFRVTRAQIISHATYDSTRGPYSDDIALIRLNRPATFNNNVQPICLPKSGFNVRSFLSGREAVAAGWGRTEGGSYSEIMKRVQIPLVNLNQCQPIYQNTLLPEQVCFGGEGGRDTCNGDSGGPVFHADPSSIRNFLIGIVSFGSPGKCGKDAAVYTNVASYRSWIIQNIRP